jgi:hypothetical protein
MEQICDGSNASVWNSGAFGSASSPVSIDLDLGKAQTVGEIQLIVDQQPSGVTSHKILGGPDLSHLTQLKAYNENTYDNETLTITGPFANIRFLRVQTFSNLSWAAWREISVFKP